MDKHIHTLTIPIIETERLLLRAFIHSDLEPYYEMMADPDITRYLMSGEPMTRHDAWRSIAMMAGHWMLHGHGQWALEEKDTGQFVGRCGIIEPEGWPQQEIGWVLDRNAWGKGYATEAAEAGLQYAFKEMKLDKIISLIQPGNHGSVKVAERIGESYEEHIEIFGKQVDVYSLTAEQYLAKSVEEII